MSLITKAEVLKYAEQYLSKSPYRADAEKVLIKAGQRAEFSESKQYDIFLCHSSVDADLILGIRELLNKMGYETYIDWYDDPELDRSNVNTKTAARLRMRMRNSKCLLVMTSGNTPDSKWIPWECGYFDALKGKVAICPISEEAVIAHNARYYRQEYFRLYPYLEKDLNELDRESLWIHKGKHIYTHLDNWINGEEPIYHRP